MVQDIQRDVTRDMQHDLGRAPLSAFFFNGTQNAQGRGLGAPNHTGADAVRAGDKAGFGQRGAKPLPAHLQQAEMADTAELDTGAIQL